MRDAPPGKPVHPSRRRKRWLILALVGAAAIGAVGLLLSPLPWPSGGQDPGGHSRWTVFHLKHKLEPPTLGIEYHFDHNAIVDSRLVGAQLLGLAASGNLVTFDAENFQVRQEKVLRRRATCLGPADESHVLAGISNGSIVRVGIDALSIEQVAEVPGSPRWIGKRAKDGALVVAYQSQDAPEGNVYVRADGLGRTYDMGGRPVLFLDRKDRLWFANGDRVGFLDLAAGKRGEVAWKQGWPDVRGFAQISDGQIWAFGGGERSGALASTIVRVSPGLKPVLLYGASGKNWAQAGPVTPITHVLEEQSPARILVVSHDGVSVTDGGLAKWQPLDALVAGHREGNSFVALGQAHVTDHRVLLTLARGGFMEVTAEFTHRHVLRGQDSVFRPFAIVRLAGGLAFYGGGGPLFYQGGKWRPLPNPVMPPAELMGPGRPGEKDRVWAAMTTIPIGGEVSYVIAKAGPHRNYVGHLHGLLDVFLTAQWDGKALTVLGREELPIEPDDTFATPDKALWNVDDRGLWSFSGGHWRMVMQAGSANAEGSGSAGGLDLEVMRAHNHFKSAIGDPLHFAPALTSPFYGLPAGASNWALVRLDRNEEGGVPLIDEVPVKVDGRQLLIHDLTIWGNGDDMGTLGGFPNPATKVRGEPGSPSPHATRELLLATDHGLCVFDVKWGNCKLLKPEGLTGEVSLFMRDSANRLWLGGRGLWLLRDQQHAVAVHPAIPMLADTRVLALAEAPDGRLVIGLEGRGAVFLTIPPGWFERPASPPSELPPWESTHAHEPSYLDRCVVIRECPSKDVPISAAITASLLSGLREFAQATGPRVHVAFEEGYERHPDVVVGGAELDTLMAGVMPLVEKLAGKARWSVSKRFGPRGSQVVEVRACPK